MATLTRSHLIKSLSEKLALSSSQASELFESTLEMMLRSLSDQESVKIAGFGSFVIRQKGKRIGRNPKTMKESLIKPRSVVLFKPSAHLRKKVQAPPS